LEHPIIGKVGAVNGEINFDVGVEEMAVASPGAFEESLLS
jgi:hypothetical protein